MHFNLNTFCCTIDFAYFFLSFSCSFVVLILLIFLDVLPIIYLSSLHSIPTEIGAIRLYTIAQYHKQSCSEVPYVSSCDSIWEISVILSSEIL